MSDATPRTFTELHTQVKRQILIAAAASSMFGELRDTHLAGRVAENLREAGVSDDQLGQVAMDIRNSVRNITEYYVGLHGSLVTLNAALNDAERLKAKATAPGILIN